MKIGRGIFVCFSLFETTEIWGVPKWKISTGKKAYFTCPEKIEKSDFGLRPLKNIPLTPLVANVLPPSLV